VNSATITDVALPVPFGVTVILDAPPVLTAHTQTDTFAWNADSVELPYSVQVPPPEIVGTAAIAAALAVSETIATMLFPAVTVFEITLLPDATD
jgi:hypothetical protein